mmetsp:Transcript_45790/g.60663  ORF Transcript_45790/g.60663 Transcript_45790/m.60663 type:complete len:200 (+) Transcript_45790:139-738(+)|eukprot:CAMPEP_0185589474 /NCGR_PEP_ID=MMETSP0434-20130131/57257_1 /TAXON_ID=626734 ORGANISM="Favella taraikaensis, Strain Fe Narragansett Bay" /NCGR_SAMPLE_ID=MMETSP0434 /ASSEMBLY_ACC=CAM_ASM_000379 /LENGTH=199 /DNA_ID=CAMNT_0028212899 /DNA_START=354 /DNA_END=953 /DNA_ORIENTATION=-
MDYKYQEGTEADCDASYCCRAESDSGTGSVKAGKFGARNYRCDVPKATVEAVLTQVVSHDPAYVFWTGDNTAHDDPFVSQDEVNAELEAVLDVVMSKLTDYDVTVSMGNHDAFPNGQWNFDTDGPSYAGREALKQYVPAAEGDRWMTHGYYKKELAGLDTVVLSLNTESCDFHNQMLWRELNDANDHLKFIDETLSEAE